MFVHVKPLTSLSMGESPTNMAPEHQRKILTL